VCDARGPRRVTLSREFTGLGLNIIGGDEHEGIFVSFVIPGGAADISGQIRRGDRLLKVRDIGTSSHCRNFLFLCFIHQSPH